MKTNIFFWNTETTNIHSISQVTETDDLYKSHDGSFDVLVASNIMEHKNVVSILKAYALGISKTGMILLKELKKSFNFEIAQKVLDEAGLLVVSRQVYKSDHFKLFTIVNINLSQSFPPYLISNGQQCLHYANQFQKAKPK